MENIRISNWKEVNKGHLRGFFSVALPSGMVLHGLGLFEKMDPDGEMQRWINPPSREWTDAKGDTQFSPLVGFTDAKTRNHFRDLVVPAVMKVIDAEKRKTRRLIEPASESRTGSISPSLARRDGK